VTHRNFLLGLSLLAALTAGCASQPRPEEVCSANWIKPRTDAAIGEFKSATEDTWSQLRRSGEKAIDKGRLGLIEKARVLLTLTSLVSSFENSKTLKDLRTLEQTCNEPGLVKNALIGTLEEYNVPPAYIELLEELEGFMNLVNQMAPQPQA